MVIKSTTMRQGTEKERHKIYTKWLGAIMNVASMETVGRTRRLPNFAMHTAHIRLNRLYTVLDKAWLNLHRYYFVSSSRLLPSRWWSITGSSCRFLYRSRFRNRRRQAVYCIINARSTTTFDAFQHSPVPAAGGGGFLGGRTGRTDDAGGVAIRPVTVIAVFPLGVDPPPLPPPLPTAEDNDG